MQILLHKSFMKGIYIRSATSGLLLSLTLWGLGLRVKGLSEFYNDDCSE